MASQARGAFLAGKQDQAHALIEELLRSLKLVGELGVGPSIGAISSNMPVHDDGLMQALVRNPAENAQALFIDAAKRVAAVAQTQGFPTGPAQAQAQAALAKQQQVLAVTAQVITIETHDALGGRAIGERPKAPSVLVQAAQAVVRQAARQVQADKTAVARLTAKRSSMEPKTPAPISPEDVSIAVQSAVAHAVAITGSESSEVEVMLTANSLIQQRSRAGSRAGLPLLPGSSASAPVVPGTNPYPHLVNPSQGLR